MQLMFSGNIVFYTMGRAILIRKNASPFGGTERCCMVSILEDDTVFRQPVYIRGLQEWMAFGREFIPPHIVHNTITVAD